MAKISYSNRAIADLEHISNFLVTSKLNVSETLNLIDEAINILARHPLVGRPAETGLHELVISKGKSGYIALYNYDVKGDVVLVLSIRHQREAGFRL
ncbi:type II toxin-antitoxin system RelE/ParE family toxin [Massilia antarctica]|uniref:Type II toxin-antitoxin system RelE/ParE family toxin n=1 Tax=Massilia antarctica TaxID=2765360 RepID=A0AA49ABN2_9BURK|nr:type II toxin-antitoxin system RelE/ParE family toxin [Massilia antarctica]QPI52835.1 type II toxin-antitoxin system RelE/ParE family toxin [Massilia antarctica]